MNNRFLCFRQTRNVHESGFRYIEFGYLSYDETGKEVIEIVGRYDVVLGNYGDNIPLHLDLTKSGWFRILPRIEADIEWSLGGTIAIVNKEATK